MIACRAVNGWEVVAGCRSRASMNWTASVTAFVVQGTKGLLTWAAPSGHCAWLLCLVYFEGTFSIGKLDLFETPVLADAIPTWRPSLLRPATLTHFCFHRRSRRHNKCCEPRSYPHMDVDAETFFNTFWRSLTPGWRVPSKQQAGDDAWAARGGPTRHPGTVAELCGFQ